MPVHGPPGDIHGAQGGAVAPAAGGPAGPGGGPPPEISPEQFIQLYQQVLAEFGPQGVQMLLQAYPQYANLVGDAGGAAGAPPVGAGAPVGAPAGLSHGASITDGAPTDAGFPGGRLTGGGIRGRAPIDRGPQRFVGGPGSAAPQGAAGQARGQGNRVAAQINRPAPQKDGLDPARIVADGGTVTMKGALEQTRPAGR